MGKEKRTVKKKIFYSEYVDGARYTAEFIAVNLVIAKVYIEIIEQDFRESITWSDNEEDLEDVLQETDGL